MRRILLLAIPFLLLGVSYLAYTLAQYGWDQVVEYKSLFTAGLTSGEAGEGLAQRVVIILVDGLRVDTSRRMANLNQLRVQGVDLVARTGQPSLSFPGWTVIGTGALQDVSGVTTNWYEGAVPVDNIFLQAQKAGLGTAMVGTPGWEQLYSSGIDKGYYLDSTLEWQDEEGSRALDQEILERALSVLEGNARLVLIYFPGPDDNGHWFGGESAQYEESVQRVDEHIAAIASALDLESTTLIVTTDHGMTALGGHGGWEAEVVLTPLVMAGAGIGQGGQRVEVSQADIAPAVAVLLGLPIPTHNQGLPLVDSLQGDQRLLAQRSWDLAKQQYLLWKSYVGQIGGRFTVTSPEDREEEQQRLLAEGELIQSHQISLDFIAESKLAGEQAREARLNSERLGRLPIALAIAILPALYHLFHPRKRELLLPLLMAVLYFVVHYALFLGRGLSWSLSAFRHEAQILDFINARLIEGALLSLLAGLLVGVIKRGASVGEVANAAVHTSFFIVYILLLQIDYFFYLWGLNFTWRLPDLMLGFKYFLDLFQLVGVAGTAVILPILALGARWVARRVAVTT